MNKKKSRKNKKRREQSNGNKSNQSNKTNDKYLDQIQSLSDKQEQAIKFLSEMLSISSQEAHIICNECKWEQSDFPSNLEEAQTMLHWNKKNTKSKIKREQNKHKQHKEAQQNKSKDSHHQTAPNNKSYTKTNHSPHHSPSKSIQQSSPSKSSKINMKTMKHSSSPKFEGFIPHKLSSSNMNRPQTPTKRGGNDNNNNHHRHGHNTYNTDYTHSHHSRHHPPRFQSKYNDSESHINHNNNPSPPKHTRSKSSKLITQNSINPIASNRFFLKTSPSAKIPPVNINNNKYNTDPSNISHSTPPNMTKIGPKSMQYMRSSYRGRGRGRGGGYSSRGGHGPSSYITRGRGGVRSSNNRNISRERRELSREQMSTKIQPPHPQHQQHINSPKHSHYGGTDRDKTGRVINKLYHHQHIHNDPDTERMNTHNRHNRHNNNHISPSPPPPSSSESGNVAKSTKDSTSNIHILPSKSVTPRTENSSNTHKNSNNMYSETLENELRSQQQQQQQNNAVKLPAEYEKDLSGTNLNNIYQPPPINAGSSHSQCQRQEIGKLCMNEMPILTQNNGYMLHEQREEEEEHEHVGSYAISPISDHYDNDNNNTEQNVIDSECKDQSFMFVMDQQQTSNTPQNEKNMKGGRGGRGEEENDGNNNNNDHEENKNDKAEEVEEAQTEEIILEDVVDDDNDDNIDNIDNIDNDNEDNNDEDEDDDDDDDDDGNGKIEDIKDIERENGIPFDFGHKYSKLFQILNGTLIVGYDSHSNMRLPPHLCMSFDTLLDLVNYQNGEILTKNHLMNWYKNSKNKLIYSNNKKEDIELFNHQSTQTLFDDFKPNDDDDDNDNYLRRRGGGKGRIINGELQQISNGNILSSKKIKERKPTRPPMSHPQHTQKKREKIMIKKSNNNNNKKKNKR